MWSLYYANLGDTGFSYILNQSWITYKESMKTSTDHSFISVAAHFNYITTDFTINIE